MLNSLPQDPPRATLQKRKNFCELSFFYKINLVFNSPGPPHKTTVDDTMIIYEDFLSLVDFSVIFLKIPVYDLQRCSESEFIIVSVKMRDPIKK